MRQESNSVQWSPTFLSSLLSELPGVDNWCRSEYGYRYSEDITSEVKLIALEKGFFEDRGVKLSTWLIQIAINLYKAQAKYRAWHPAVDNAQVNHTLYYPDIIIDDGFYTILIEELPKKLRVPLKYSLQGYPVRDISDITGLKATSIKSRLWEARTSIKRKLELCNSLY